MCEAGKSQTYEARKSQTCEAGKKSDVLGSTSSRMSVHAGKEINKEYLQFYDFLLVRKGVITF